MSRTFAACCCALWLAPICFANEAERIDSGNRAAGSFTDVKNVQFSRDIAPILAANCYECHGPDAAQRQAGLRLDTQRGATQPVDSGAVAIIPHDLAASAVWQRISTDDDDLRMPPSDSHKSLTAGQRNVIKTWIKQGARWSQHWSWTRPPLPVVPPVLETTWPNNTIDHFILSQLERHGIPPAQRADRYTLIRRVYLNLLGLVPTPDEIQQFVNDDSSDAVARLVERLLSSPRYGERWSRHWLDVARYGDSNGGDENHAYPLAYHYRDYVVRSWNADVPFSQFIAEQIAGDLLAGTDDPEADARRTAATGFLAIGMKILAEQDPVKKQADMVDEQIDTVGRAFLGLSLGCARCHDHKFDPVTTADYYALAGILHSSTIGDRPLETPDYLAAKAQHDDQRLALEAQRKQAAQTLERAIGVAIERQAEEFDRGNVVAQDDGYGEGIGIISDPGGQSNFVEYDFQVESAGKYTIQLRYAAKTPRPGPLLLDGTVLTKSAMAHVTGGWHPDHQQWVTEANAQLSAGRHTLRLESAPTMVHIDRWRIILGGTDAFDDVTRLEQKYAKLVSAAPQPTIVMAVSEGTAHDVAIHRRGSHLDLGEKVPRRFIESLSQHPTVLPTDRSGRRELANWLTDTTSGAGFLAARVIVNRVWHWQFGRGLVASTDDFGLRGDHPSHPALLDYITHKFIESGWSLKWLHREIILSATYQMRSNVPHDPDSDPDNTMYWEYPSRRLEPEVLRDVMLQLSHRLDSALYGKPPAYKSQDPSPQDLANNRKSYESSPRRSIYLPIVRTNVYEFFTLFDFPNASSPVGKRDETTVPTQALFLLNSQYVEQLARDIVRHTQGPDVAEASVAALYLTVVGRLPTPREVAAAQQFIRRYSATMDPSLASNEKRLEAWTAFCHTLLMSNQFVHMN